MTVARWKFGLVQGLTLVRMPLIFVFLGISVFARPPISPIAFVVAFAAMILSAVTDLVDGYLARRFGCATRFGAYADPLTDKVFYLTTLPALVYLAARAGQIEHAQQLLVLAVLFLLRDQWISFLRSIGAIYQVDSKANWSGKARTLLAFPAICVVYYYLEAPAGWPIRPPGWLVWAAEVAIIAVNLVSIWVYTRYYWPWMRKELRTQPADASPPSAGDQTRAEPPR